MLPDHQGTAKRVMEPELVLLAKHLVDSLVTAADIQLWTNRDEKLSRVLQYDQGDQGVLQGDQVTFLTSNHTHHVVSNSRRSMDASCGERGL